MQRKKTNWVLTNLGLTGRWQCDKCGSIRAPERPRATWMNNIHDDLSLLDLGIHEARDLAQNRLLWSLMSLHIATHS